MTVRRVDLPARQFVTVDPDGGSVEGVADGSVVRVSCPAGDGGRRRQLEAARLARAAGAAHVVLEPPEPERRAAPKVTPFGWRDAASADAIRRWFAERPPRGADPEAALGEALDAVAEAERTTT